MPNPSVKSSLVACLFLTAAGCSSSSARSSAAAATATDAGTSSVDFRVLAQGDWQLDAGSEGYFCVRKTLPKDTWIAGFRPISPPGTHHTVLSVEGLTGDAGAPKPDGTEPCEAITLGSVLLGGSGVGTAPYLFPEGVAVKIPAGKQILLNLHVFNSSTDPISGTSGIEALEMDEGAVVHEAELVEAGKILGLTVPPGASTQTGTCTLQADVTVFSVGPHMHRLGTHMMTRAVPAHGSPTTLLDRDYSFDDQSFDRLAEPVQLHAGDAIEVNCTYENPQAVTVGFGQSTRDEMCFTATYLYPPLFGGGFCFQ